MKAVASRLDMFFELSIARVHLRTVLIAPMKRLNWQDMTLRMDCFEYLLQEYAYCISRLLM